MSREARIPEELFISGAWAQLNCAACRVLAVFFLHANEEMECWPSLKTLSRLSGVNEGHVYRAVDELVKAGIVRRLTSAETRTSGGRGRSTRYAITPALAREFTSGNSRISAPVSGSKTPASARGKLPHGRAVTPALARGISRASAVGTSSLTAHRTAHLNNGHDSSDQVGGRLESGEETDSGHDDDLAVEIPGNASDDQIVSAIQARWPDADRPGILAALRHPHITSSIVRTGIAQVERAGRQGVGSLLKVIKAKADVAAKRASAQTAERNRDAVVERDRIAAEIEAGEIGDEELRAVYPGPDPDVVRADRVMRGEAAKRIALRRRRSEAVPA